MIGGVVLVIRMHQLAVGAALQPAQRVEQLRILGGLADRPHAGNAPVQARQDRVDALLVVGGGDGRLRLAVVAHRGDVVGRAEHPALDDPATRVVTERGEAVAGLSGDAGHVVALGGIADQGGFGVVVLPHAAAAVVDGGQIAVDIVAVQDDLAVRQFHPSHQLGAVVAEADLAALPIGERGQQPVRVAHHHIQTRIVRVADCGQLPVGVELAHLAIGEALTPAHRACLHVLQHGIGRVLAAKAVVADRRVAFIGTGIVDDGRSVGPVDAEHHPVGKGMAPAHCEADVVPELAQRMVVAGERPAGELEVHLGTGLVAGRRIDRVRARLAAGALLDGAGDLM